ncbi:MAG: hypothetical protein FWD48_12545 [Oscillospiraceae bacterium]|nr:hypothetical protein [Oscillospiraceae bacterium]
MQKTDKTGWHCEDRVELEGNSGAQSDCLAEAEVEDGATSSLLEQLLSRRNLNEA